MTIYIDMTLLYKSRANTGIQRVVKELLKRAFSDNDITYKIISYNEHKKSMQLHNSTQIKEFLADTKNYIFQETPLIDIFNLKVTKTTIFFDIDSPWNLPIEREKLYPVLKNNGFKIFNFIYDLVPIILPQYAHEQTVKNFSKFLDSLYNYSDMVFFDSASAQNDFQNYKKILNISRLIPTRSVSLGSDFYQNNEPIIDSNIKNILKKKYILFVGTLEPRKNQEDVLEAFETLIQNYPDLNLVFIGKRGWKVNELIQKIQKHPLKNKNLYWLNDIDDNTLNHFYQNAFIVTYLSKYEGYGLPIAESLNFANITIASKNSSMYEVGKDCADYISYNSKNELVDIISLYYDNKELYKLKKEFIKENYLPISWDTMANSVFDVFKNYEKSISFKQNHQKTLQFVFISIEIKSLIGTIEAIDKYINFVKEYIIVTAPKFVKEFNTINTKNNITIIDETTILGEYSKSFSSRDHVSKNWLLRASLLNLDILEDEFIMLDDDNRPIKPISIDKFINEDGSYNAYYFHELLKWNHKGTEYDIGQQTMKKVLNEQNYELYSYSSHAPQIINKKLFKEVIDKFFITGLKKPIDEWSIYFNYAISHYPLAFNKKIFQTINWPQSPFQWDFPFEQDEISFENYYKEVYDNGIFTKDTTYEEKLKIKEKETNPFQKSKQMLDQALDIYSNNNMVHGICTFKNDEIEFYLSGIPYFLVLEQNSTIRLKLNYKLLNISAVKQDISLVIFLNGTYRTLRNINMITNSKYQESIIEMPIISSKLHEGIYTISFHLLVNNKYIYSKKSPYLLKLVVSKDKNFVDILDNPQILEDNIKQKSIKQKIKSIPILGWAIRWSYNILRLNNLKHIAYSNKKDIQNITDQLKNQQIQIATLLECNHQQQENIKNSEEHIQTLLRHNHQHHQNYKKISDGIRLQINKQISTQSILFHQRIDNFIDGAKQSKLKPQALKENITSFCLDDYYLSFEETFRGSQEYILQRYKKYLKYLNPDIKKALDIGCGRGEWTGLLQKNSIDAYGIDLNFAMLNAGTGKGVKNLQKVDAFDFFKSCPDSSFDMVTAFHIIEHIPFEKLFVFLMEIKRIASPNALILIETPNPANPIVANFEFYKDPTHLNPLPSDVVKFMIEYIGFKDVKVDFLHPHPTNKIAQDYLIIAKNSKIGELKSNNEELSKPKLAFISPFPPLKTGIANYSAELIPYLLKYYDIELIVHEENINNIFVGKKFPIRTSKWFEINHEYYDRVLYHFGNSAFHSYMIPLLQKIPGAIVLHDFYLGNLMGQAGMLNKELFYQLHGYKPLQDTDKSTLVWEYPCNKDILNASKGIVVHSEYSKTLASHWYSDLSLKDWSVIPLMRESLKLEDTLLDKEALILPKDSFIVCTFGLIGKSKKNQELLEAWLCSSLFTNPNCYLIFVGENDTMEYGENLVKIINNNENISITGWVDSQTFKDYLNLADMAVQLRSFSRGETSAALLDCMNYALPTITNANGSIAELPNDTLYMLEDKFKVEELTLALETLYFDTKKRETLSKKAKAYITKMHNPQACASMYKDVIERAYSPSKEPQINLDVETLSLTTLDKAKQKQILVDISSIIKDDLKTGIQRVVRSQLIELIKNSPDNIRIEPVYLSNSHYCYARSYTTKLLNLQTLELPDEPINVNSGDIFYGLDLNAKEISKSIELGIYERYKSIGVKFYFVVYDLLPILNPEFFPKSSKQIHTQWLKNITQVADKLICISNVVEAEVKAFSDVEVTSLHLGANIVEEITNTTRTIKEKPTFLMVGTIEPRKGHSQVLEAFEELWMEGVDVNLIIVGKKGWMVEEFIEKFTSHPELNNRLTYLEAISDEELCNIYISSDCLIAASQAEGFGLPLIEAAQYNLPIIARDISVFREVASTNAYYFKDTKDSKELALSIKNWLKLYKENSHPLSSKMQYLSWKENAQKLFEIF